MNIINDAGGTLLAFFLCFSKYVDPHVYYYCCYNNIKSTYSFTKGLMQCLPPSNSC
jgi:hypothetical protein